MTTYIVVAIAVAVLVILAARLRGAGRRPTTVIESPSLGVLNLAGNHGEALLAQDLPIIRRHFSETRTAQQGPLPCDVLLLYCEISRDGAVNNSAFGLRELIRDSGASIVVVATEHPIEAYIAAAPQRPFGHANLVMTLERKGESLANFLAQLFQKMNAGISMPVAWNQLAPQVPGSDHPDAPGTVFACERGQIAFGAAQQGVAPDDRPRTAARG
jgi:hypothetical protein